MAKGSLTSTTLACKLPPEDLLAYYKSRVECFEEERKDLLNKIDALTVDQAELHRLEWENKQRSGEIWELQKAISSANNELFEERGRLLKIQSENDDLKFQAEENRKKIQYLLSLTNVGEQEITYLRDQAPSTINIAQSAPFTGKKDPCLESTLRTVYLPTANADSLILKVQSLQTQLNEQRQHASERVKAVAQDRQKMEEAFSNHRLTYEQKIENFGHKTQRLEEMLRHCTRDYILARRAKQENEERAVEAESTLNQLTATVDDRVQQLRDTAATQLQKIKKTTEETIDEYCKKFRDQILHKEKELSNLELILETTRKDYEARMTELEEKTSRVHAKNKQLETRRVLEKEGFMNEVSLLRKKVDIVDRRLHQMRLVERLGDDDRLDRMLHSLENKMPDLADVDGAFLKTCNLSDVTSEMQKIQNALGEIEHHFKKSS